MGPRLIAQQAAHAAVATPVSFIVLFIVSRPSDFRLAQGYIFK
jgi:hypothetical protein